MLKSRILTTIIGLPVLTVSILLGGIPFAIVVFIISAIAMREFLSCFTSAGYKPLAVIGYLGCLPAAAAAIPADDALRLDVAVFFFIALIIATMAFAVFNHTKHRFIDASVTITALSFIPIMLLFLILIRDMQNGLIFVWFVFIGAWAADTAAYFVGRKLGRHKLIPQISPNKTVEGSVAGLAAAVVFTVLYGMIAYHPGYLPHYVMIGLISGIFSQMGDLAASTVKRFTGVKDFGSVLPGHGGIMDRFDSILLIAPLIYFYLRVFFA